MSRGISLANKCQLLFGAAVVLIVAAALIVPWVRLARIVDESQLEASRQIAELWSAGPQRAEGAEGPGSQAEPAAGGEGGSAALEPARPGRDLLIRWFPASSWSESSAREPFLASAARALPLVAPPGAPEAGAEFAEALWAGSDRLYRLARIVRDEEGKPSGVVVVERRSSQAARQLLLNRVLVVVSGLGAGALAVLVFYLITTRLFLQPVRVLKETAERVRGGDLSSRADLRTGDEFEQLGDAFNSMLSNLSEQQQLLRGINKSLDMRLNELTERNTALYEAARLKGEFLANISHELRTPLNSIIGFAEILQDIAKADADGGAPGVEPAQLVKRKRYLDNIVSAGRGLLEMINELLAMAKIEAGNVELHIQPVNVGETCEALVALIRPLADRKNLRLSLELQAPGGFTADATRADLPAIETDQQKFQQIVFNFLSNAVKFTPDGGQVIVRSDRLTGGDGQPRLRVSVLDTGPGIPASQHEYIFEKFSQLDSGHTKRHQGTGLGLAIAREFAELLQGEIQLVSEVGRGSMFSLVLPSAIDPVKAQGASRRLADRAATAGARARRPAPPPQGLTASR